MSSRNILRNEQVLVPGSTTAKYGRYFSLTSSGANQVKGQPLEPHAFSMLLTDKYDMLASISVNCNGTGGLSYGAVQATFVQARAWTSADDYKLYGKLEEAYDKGGFNAGVFAGELGETVNLLADRTKQLAKAIRAAKKGRFGQAASILRGTGNGKVSPSTGKRHRDDAGPQHPQSVSNGWLELQYGWIPLCKDIWELADQIAKADKPRKKRLFARHFIGLNPSCSSPSLWNTTGGGRHSKQIIAYVTEDIPSWPQALGLMDPELVAWELVPFSFVADWFIPVGNWLQARAFASRAKGQFVMTETWKCNVRMSTPKLFNCQGSGIWKTYTAESIGFNRYVSVNRTVGTSLPQVPLPSFSNGIGKGYRLQNAAALLAGIFGGKK